MAILAISNQKGGVAKTTTAVNLAAALAARGQRVLLADLDPQANATSALGVTPRSEAALHRCLLDGLPAVEIVTAAVRERLDLLPAHAELAGLEVDLAASGEHLERMRAALRPLVETGRWDWILMDTPPSLGAIMTGALGAADELLVPLQCEYFGLEGLARIVSIAETMRGGPNPGLRLEGIVMTMFDRRTNLSRQVVADVREHFPALVYRTLIPRTVRLGEAPSYGQTILEYDPSGVGAEAHRALAAEFMRRRGDADAW